jgi:hypothetical protein
MKSTHGGIVHTSTIIRIVILVAFSAVSASFTPLSETDAQPVSAECVTASDSMSWFGNPAMRQVLEKHDHFLPALKEWRRMWGQHAGALAQLVKTFPGSENLRESVLRDIISDPAGLYDTLVNHDVFEPWTKHWSGAWSNGRMQYHIWNLTVIVGGRWIQPVTLSETAFVDYCSIDTMMQRNETDIAINVFSAADGITGWVSKRQHGRIELPHIGYLVNDTTLLWICREQKSEQSNTGHTPWYIFLETVRGSGDSAEYMIYGQPAVIEDSLSADEHEQGKHHGTYHASVSEIQQVPSWTSR